MARAKTIDWDKKNGAAENAESHLPTVVRDYFAEVRSVLARDPAPAELHQLRLASKRLRYTLELFRPCYSRGLETRIERLKEIQTLLGDCNDAVVTAARVNQLFTTRAERTRFRKILEKRAADKAARFQRQWTKSFDAPGEEASWIAYLSRNARPPVKG